MAIAGLCVVSVWSIAGDNLTVSSEKGSNGSCEISKGGVSHGESCSDFPIPISFPPPKAGLDFVSRLLVSKGVAVWTENDEVFERIIVADAIRFDMSFVSDRAI